ncbi:glutamine--tRNA ligase/YqeY domain fusion protein [Brackiella oedipodis]|uniref:glutamine--tRNA ligase/YqeY domain fusion protein n=1 Tax=Brackiella oedipodis TaxID=124225 RepID=UPI00048E2C33|nr:glutamine--tRNA ligase/YqeY domain fusion protein [Brackiella oedipodis]
MSTSSTSPVASNFLRNIIEHDLKSGRLEQKHWSGTPGPAAVQANAPLDPARIRTRFPPEPNGYLHLGHAKSICINFGLAQDYEGTCHLRFDDTNPEKEEAEYVNSIIDAVKWLGFDWHEGDKENLFFASDYFDYMYEFAHALIDAGLAYVDEQTPEQIRSNRGTLTAPGVNSPYRDRPIAESKDLFQRMRTGEFADGSLCLRAKVDMASPNINMRDPVIYRIRHAEHHRTGTQWPIYPMYTFAHPIEDALEGITHSICTLEFEDQRPFYNWLLEHLQALGKLLKPLPHQHEFSRLNMTYIVTSKRKLLQLVKEQYVNGWDDPRLPTLSGLRRRGYTPEAIRLFCERLGVSKSESRIDFSLLEQALRDCLDPVVDRSVAILDPIKLIISNYPEGQSEMCHAPKHPHHPEQGQREFPFSRELWIERDDFMEDPPKKYFRLFPGNTVRLKYAYVVRCTGFEKDADGKVTTVYAEYLPDTKSGTPGSSSVKVKGNITWINAADAQAVTINLYDRLFTDPIPDAGDKNYLDAINPQSLQQVQALIEPGTTFEPGQQWQFERLGYFIVDPDSTSEHIIINRSTTMRDTWVKK